MKPFALLLAFIALSLTNLNAQVSFTSSEACYGTLTGLQDNSGYADTSISEWAWDLDNDGQFDDAWGKSTNYIFGSAGTIVVGLEITFNSGSTESVTQDVIVHALPQVNFYVDNLCEDVPATFTDNSSILVGETIDKYYWDFNDDGSADDTGKVVQFNLGVAGLYVTTLECVSTEGCSSNTSKQNEVYDKPYTDFSTSGSSRVGEATEFVNSTTIPSGTLEIYVWDFGDGKGSSVISPSHEWDTAMTFSVQLVAISNQDCRDTLIKDIDVAEAMNIELGLGVESEVVTPNGDEINDYLKINGFSRYTGCSVTVYNIWNEEIYSNAEYDNEEEKSFSGLDLDAGAYYYTINCDGEEVLGVINILR